MLEEHKNKNIDETTTRRENRTTIVRKRRRKNPKRWKRPWLWRAGHKQGWGLGSGWDLCLRPTGLEKALGGMGVWGLDLMEQKGPRCASHFWSESRGPHLVAEQASQVQVGKANALCASPAPLVLEGPSLLLLLFSPRPPSYSPRTNAAQRVTLNA